MQAGPSDNFLLSYLGIALFSIIFVCSVSFLISFLTGWLALAPRFKKQSEPYGDVRSVGPFFYTVYMRGWSHYGSMIRLTAASDALFISILLPFRIGHPPLRIPGGEIQFGRTKFFFRSYIVLTLGNQEKIPTRISLRMARNLGILDRCPA